jgi:hypothetical protein
LAQYEHAVMDSLLEVMDYDGVTVAGVSELTGVPFGLLLDAFTGVLSIALAQVEQVCVALGLDVAEQLGEF